MPPRSRRRLSILDQLAETPLRGALLAVRLAAVLLLVVILQLLGVWDVIDGQLERTYYGIRGTRTSHQSVVLVAIDDETVSRWGPPPYSWDRLAPIHAAIVAGRPSVVAVVEPGLRLLGGDTPPPEVAGAVYARRLLVPAPAGGSSAPGLAAGRGGTVDAVLLRSRGGATLTAEILERSGLPVPAEDRLPVNFVGTDGLPVVSAARVAAGAIPGGTFAGKIVLLGIHAELVGGQVMTPIGELSPAAIHAHALLGLTDGVAWRRTAGWARWLLLALLALAILLVVPQLDESRALAGSVAAAVLFLLADYLFFSRGVVRWGASAAVFTVVAAVIVAGFDERRRLRLALAEVGREVRLRSGLDSLGGESRADDQAFWLRVAELARLYLECRSSIVAELPQGRWHLSLRVITGATIEQIQEKRRDIRRGPYRRAHLTLNPVWQDDFMSAQRGEKTLLVPLVVSTRLFGFWILNFPVDAHLEPPQVKLVSALARQISLAVEKRQRIGDPEGSLMRRLLGEGRLGVRLDAVSEDVKRLAGDKRTLASLVDGLPFGVVVGTLWGEVRYANAAMRKLTEHEGEGSRLHTQSVPEIVVALSGLPKEQVHDAMRRLLRELPELHIPGRTEAGGRRARLHLILTWLSRDDERQAADDGEQLLVLCALPARLASRTRARPSDFQDEGTTQMRVVGAGLAETSDPGTPLPADPAQSAPPVESSRPTTSPGVTDSFDRLAADSGATERVPLEQLDSLMADLASGAGGEADEVRGVVDALRQANTADTASHVLLGARPGPPRRTS
jgi:hypothetical protein